MAQQTFDELADAVMQAESRGKRYAADGKTLTTSAKGALGEMQVMPKTSRDPGFGVVPVRDQSPDEIARVGRDYLQAMMGKYGNMENALVAYNMGPGSTDKWIAAGAKQDKLPEETRTYVQRVKGFLGGSVPRETKQVKKAKPAESLPSLPPMAAAPAMKQQVADLGPGYQAALALSFLADTDDNEERDIDREPGIAEKYMAEMDAAPRTSSLAEFADVKIKSPFAEPAQPQMLAHGGAVQHLAGGGLPFVPSPRVTSSARKQLESIKSQYDTYNTQADAYNAAIAAHNAGTRDSEFLGTPPTVPGTSVAQYEALGAKARKDAANRNLALQVAANPEQFNFSMDRLFAKGGEVEQVGEESLDTYYAPKARPSTGLNRKEGPISQALNSGEAYVNIAKGLTEMPYNLVGAPMDLAMLVRQGLTGRAPEGQVGTSDYIKKKMTELGIRPAPPTDPTAKGFYDAGDLLSNVVNPAGVTRAGVKTAQVVGKKTGDAARMLEDITVGNIQRGKVRQAGAKAENIPDSAYDPLRERMEASGNLALAVKPRGGTFAYTDEDLVRAKPASSVAKLVRNYWTEARDSGSDEVLDFLKAKAPKYFTTSYGTANDPLRTAIRERRIEPFGLDAKRIKPSLVDEANNPDSPGYLQAKLDLEKAYDDLTGIQAHSLQPENASFLFGKKMEEDISTKLGQEGVAVEARNLPIFFPFAPSHFKDYPLGSQLLNRLVTNQKNLPPNLQQALRTGEPIYDASPLFNILEPNNVIEALQQVPANKLKNMSFPEALIQGTQALAPVRNYLAAVTLAEKGSQVPRKALDMFTTPVMQAPSFGGQWVKLDESLAAKMEGSLMKHSVKDYNFGTLYGTAYTGLPYGGKKAFDEGLVRVYSLRDDQGLPKVTLEMAKSDGGKGNTWNVTQIRGPFNSEPLPETKKDIFQLLDKVDAQEGLNNIKPNSYTKLPTGENGPGTEVNWAKEYDLWTQGAK
jgi:hypothetical protein